MKIVNSCSAAHTERPALNAKINKYAVKKNLQKAGDNKYHAYTVDFQGSRTCLTIKTVAALVVTLGFAYPLSKKVRNWCEILRYGGKLIGMQKIVAPNNSSTSHSTTSTTHPSFNQQLSTSISAHSAVTNYQFSKNDLDLIVNDAIKASATSIGDELNDTLKNLNTHDIELFNQLYNDFENERIRAKLEKQKMVKNKIGNRFQYNLKNFTYSSNAGAVFIHVACHKINKTTSTLGEAPSGPKISLTPRQINLLFGCFYLHTNGGKYLCSVFSSSYNRTAYDNGVKIIKK